MFGKEKGACRIFGKFFQKKCDQGGKGPVCIAKPFGNLFRWFFFDVIHPQGLILLYRHDRKYLMVVNTLDEQQSTMFKDGTHQVDHRIVSIHQPHVCPIVRGKTNAYVEFGAKINVSIMNGFAFLDDFSWEAFNEGNRLISTSLDRPRRHTG